MGKPCQFGPQGPMAIPKTVQLHNFAIFRTSNLFSHKCWKFLRSESRRKLQDMPHWSRCMVFFKQCDLFIWKHAFHELLRWFSNRLMSCVPWSKLLILGMVIPPLIGNPYNGYINPYYWVDDHPLLYGNNGSLDPDTCDDPRLLSAFAPCSQTWDLLGVLGTLASPSFFYSNSSTSTACLLKKV